MHLRPAGGSGMREVVFLTRTGTIEAAPLIVMIIVKSLPLNTNILLNSWFLSSLSSIFFKKKEICGFSLWNFGGKLYLQEIWAATNDDFVVV